ncbi:MAG: DUF2142 domain-containing protein [Anaerolineaceae bacterium]|nr:DUF2142 domain-containing protein [Anaerolineaceae bacterium]
MVRTLSNSSLLRKPAEIFLFLGLLFGIAGVVFIPYGAGFDEEQHLARIIEMSDYVWIPNTSYPGGAYIYPEVLTLSYQRRYFLEPAGDLLSEKFSRRNDRENLLFFTSRSIYNPVIFLPQALITRWFWRKYDYPFIPIVILCRLAGLFLYLAGSYLAIRVIPVGKWVLAALALAPMALFQAATLSADGFTHAASFLFIGFGVEFLLNPDQPRRSWKIWGFAASLIFLGMAKSGPMLLLPLLLFLPYRRFPSRAWSWTILGTTLLCFAIAAGWSALSIPTSHYGQSDTTQNFNAHLSLIFSDPIDFLRASTAEYTSRFGEYYRNWLASYGHWIGVVPTSIFWLFPLVLGAAVLAEPRQPSFDRRKRLILIVLALLSTVLTALFFFALFYKPGMSASYGKQGRYFIVTLPLLFISFSAAANLPARLHSALRGLTISLLLLVLGLYSFGLYATYYSYCGSTYYTFQSCVQPVYKQIDLDTAPIAVVHSEAIITQSFTSVCGAVEGVRVRTLDIPAGISGTLTLSLFDNNDSLLGSTDVPAASIKSREYINLTLPEPIPSAGSQYQIQITSPDIDPAQGFPLLAATADQYLEGSLAINGFEQENDLIFKYTCPFSWSRIFR